MKKIKEESLSQALRLVEKQPAYILVLVIAFLLSERESNHAH